MGVPDFCSGTCLCGLECCYEPTVQHTVCLCPNCVDDAPCHGCERLRATIARIEQVLGPKPNWIGRPALELWDELDAVLDAEED